jgi:hypothetical protein
MKKKINNDILKDDYLVLIKHARPVKSSSHSTRVSSKLHSSQAVRLKKFFKPVSKIFI